MLSLIRLNKACVACKEEFIGLGLMLINSLLCKSIFIATSFCRASLNRFRSTPEMKFLMFLGVLGLAHDLNCYFCFWSPEGPDSVPGGNYTYYYYSEQCRYGADPTKLYGCGRDGLGCAATVARAEDGAGKGNVVLSTLV